MPFRSSKQRKYLYASKPDVAKKLSEHKYRYGGFIGGGQSVGGTGTEGTPNRHVFKEGGVTCGPTKEQLAYNARYDAVKKYRKKK